MHLANSTINLLFFYLSFLLNKFILAFQYPVYQASYRAGLAA